MTHRVLRLLALGAVALSVAGCISYSDHTHPAAPSSVVVTPQVATPAPAPSTVVVTPAQ